MRVITTKQAVLFLSILLVLSNCLKYWYFQRCQQVDLTPSSVVAIPSYFAVEEKQRHVNAALIPTPLLEASDIRNTSSSSQEEAFWAFPGFFHFVNNITIEGTASVAIDKPKGTFNFDNSNLWETSDSPYLHYRYKPGCLWCPLDLDYCITGALQVEVPPDYYGVGINKTVQRLIEARPYTSRKSRYYPKYRALVLLCELQPSLNQLGWSERFSGVLRFEGNRDFLGRTNPYLPQQPAFKQDVVCSRGLYGDVTALALERFASFYLTQWRFARVVVYDIGM
jgi:hypothetical protein